METYCWSSCVAVGVCAAAKGTKAAIRTALHSFEVTSLTILPHAVPHEVPPVHRDVDARGKHLHERQRTPEIEEPIGAAERVRHHRAGEHDRLPQMDSGPIRLFVRGTPPSRSARRIAHPRGRAADRLSERACRL